MNERMNEWINEWMNEWMNDLDKRLKIMSIPTSILSSFFMGGIDQQRNLEGSELGCKKKSERLKQ